MKYGILVQDFDKSVDICGFGFQNEGLKAGHLFEWTNKNSMYKDGEEVLLLTRFGTYIPMSIAVEISKSEYNRIKALREPTQELTVAEIEEKLGYKVKIIKEK